MGKEAFVPHDSPIALVQVLYFTIRSSMKIQRIIWLSATPMRFVFKGERRYPRDIQGDIGPKRSERKHRSRRFYDWWSEDGCCGANKGKAFDPYFSQRYLGVNDASLMRGATFKGDESYGPETKCDAMD